MRKRIILVIIVATEIFLGSLFLFKVFQEKTLSNKVLGINTVAGIDKTRAIIEQNSELKYYWTLGPGEWKEQPEWLPYEVTYHINSDGLREFKDYSVEKPADTFRIIALGDSFTYGHHVNVEDSWPKKLEKMLASNVDNCKYKNFEVINLGMPGYDVQYIVQRYKEIGQKYHPDLILWFDPGTGFTRHSELVEPQIKACRDTNLQSDIKQNKNDYNEFARCQTKVYQQLLEDYSADELSKSILNDLDKYAELENTDKTVIFFYKTISSQNQETIDIWQSRYQKITFANLVPNLTNDQVLADRHPNSNGHQVIANSIAEYLNNEKEICK